MATKKLTLDLNVRYVGSKITEELDAKFGHWCIKYKRKKCDVIRELIEDLLEIEEEEWS